MKKEIGLNELFFDLIQVAIGCRVCLSHSPSADEWGELYAMAKKQSLVGVCFAGVQRLQGQAQTPEEMLYLTWMGMAAKIQQRNEEVNRQCVDLQKRLSADGLRSAILKGQGVAALYRLHDNVNDDDNSLNHSNNSVGEQSRATNLSLLRQSGDIDVWVDGGMENAMTYAVKRFGQVEFDYINAHLPVFDSTEVELHWRAGHLMSLPKNARFQKWVEENKQHLTSGSVTMADGSELVVPDVVFNRVYVLLHIFNHEFSEGIGLRQLMDYSFVLRKAMPTEEDKRDFKEIVTSLGMWRFAKAVMWIMQRVFAVPAEHLMCEADEQEGAYILAEVMQNGNFGHHDERVSKALDNRYLGTLSRSLQHNWHLASHYPSMIFWSPVWYVYHFFWKRIWKMKHKELFV